MPGGRFDSSRTRVQPVFDALYGRDPSGESWLPALLALARHGSAKAVPPSTLRGSLRKERCKWGPEEEKLPAPRSLLEWLVENVEEPAEGFPKASPETDDRRRKLLRRDPDTIRSALAELEREQRSGWHVLEGRSQPDVYLETDELVVVIEGKRTEAGPTTHTTWMPVRHQMLRHLDAAWELRGERALYGFFIVEAEEGASGEPAIPKHWADAARETLSDDALTKSLPHRTPGEREAIARSFLGVTTWQTVCDELGVDRSHLLERAP